MRKAGILIVEDEYIIAMDIKSSLTNLGYEVVGTAASGEEAIIKTNESHPDLILMDIMLKGEMDGIEAAEQILMQVNVPFIFLTAYANDAVLRRAKIIQPFAYIVKPFRESELRTNIEIALYRNKMEKKLRRREIAAREELEQQVKERAAQVVAANKKLRFLASQLLTAQETERERLSLELHDDLGQSLQVLKMQLSSILRQYSPEPEIRQGLEEAIAYLLRVIDKVRRLSRDLIPPALENLGLSEALWELFEEFQKSHVNEMVIKAVLDEVKDILSKEVNTVIYRITQEFLVNVHKHSEATQVAVAIKALPEKVTITLEDNGKGFDLEEIKNRPKEQRGLGMASMEERLRILGSQLHLTSQPGKGTRLYFEILLTPEQKLQ